LASALLQRGNEVKCLVRPTSNSQHLEEMGAQLVEGDVTSPESVRAAVKNVDYVYHLAGAVKALTPRLMWQSNTTGTQTVVDACAARTTPPTLLHVSSIAAAGPSTSSDQPKRECDPCRPVSRYGRSKRGGEVAAAKVAGRMPVTIVRPPVVFGPRDGATLALFRPIRSHGVLTVPDSRKHRYSFIHSDDLVDALILSAEEGNRISFPEDGTEGFGQGCYFVGYDPPVTYVEFGNIVARAVGRERVRSVRVHKYFVRSAGRIVDVYAQVRRQPHIFSFDKAKEAVAGSWTCSSDLIGTECGFRPAHSLEERISETADWLFEHGWLRAHRGWEEKCGLEETPA
jgi:nucleoside-diphosphate-sugar epimerase